MATTHPSHAPVAPTPSRSTAKADPRAGYVGAALVNVALVWVVNHLLEWGWPPFLTAAFEDLVPWITVSLVASIAVNLVWAAFDPPWLRNLGQLGLDLIAVVVIVRGWQIFPLDLAPGWEVLARLLHAIALFGVSIDAVTRVIGLARAGRARRRCWTSPAAATGCVPRARRSFSSRVRRLPRRALGPPQDDQPDRVHVLDGQVAHQGHQGPRLPSR